MYAAYAEPDADFDALAAEQAELKPLLPPRPQWQTTSKRKWKLPPMRASATWDAVVGNLSGAKNAAALCRLLLSSPTCFCLTAHNHLDAESVEWLEQFLRKVSGTVVAVTHDRYFLDNAADWILELDRGHGIPWKGNYTSWLEQKEQRLKQEEAAESARQRTIKKELEWVRQNPKGRQAKAKARLSRFEELSSHEYQRRNETQEIFIPVAERLGNEVIEFRNVSKGYGDRLLIDDLSFKVPAGAIVGIIGPNGAGKSTLFRMISGQEQPDSGEISIGQTYSWPTWISRARLARRQVCIRSYRQRPDILTRAVSKCRRASHWPIQSEAIKVNVGDLSGGERSACIWPRRLSWAVTCCCLTSPPTTRRNLTGTGRRLAGICGCSW